VDLDNIEDQGPGGVAQSHAVVVSNPSEQLEAYVTITRTDGTELSFSNRTVAPRSAEIYLMPTDRGIDGSGVFSNNAWHVNATVPVTVHQFNPFNGENVFTNDASLLLPSAATGNEYLVMAWPYRYAPGGMFIPETDLRGYATVVAVSEGQTQVTVHPTVAVASGPGLSAVAAGGSQTVELDEGEVLSLSNGGTTSGADLTGTLITSDKNIAVFGGHECANVPTENINYCDHLEQQLFPLASWGYNYVSVPFKPRNNAQKDRLTILGGADGAQVRTMPPQPFDGVILSRGQKFAFDTTQAFTVSSAAPILVAQYLHGSNYTGFGLDPRCPIRDFGGNPVPCGQSWECGTGAQCINSTCVGTGIGDPAFTLGVPIEQYRADYVVLTPPGYVDNYLNIVIHDGAEVVLDGQQVTGWTVIAGSGISYKQQGVEEGVHILEGAQPFGLVAYGYDCDVSYAYPGGLNLENLR
jgi:hypothetical protein